MDQQLFLEKLSEVCDWEWAELQGQTNHNWRAETDDPPPKYIKILKMRGSDCDSSRDYHAQTVIKNYTYQRTTFLVERCPKCGVARTKNSGWFKIEHISGIAQQAFYEEFGGVAKPYQRQRVVKDSEGRIFLEGNYSVQEDENSVIRKLVDK